MGIAPVSTPVRRTELPREIQSSVGMRKAPSAFLTNQRRLQQERIAAFTEYVADVNEGHFPNRSNTIEMKDDLLAEVKKRTESDRC